MQSVQLDYRGRNETLQFHSAEKQLWCAVVGRALQDAMGNVATASTGVQRAQLREDARNWFIRNDLDFQAACSAAGYDPAAVRMRILRMIGVAA